MTSYRTSLVAALAVSATGLGAPLAAQEDIDSVFAKRLSNDLRHAQPTNMRNHDISAVEEVRYSLVLADRLNKILQGFIREVDTAAMRGEINESSQAEALEALRSCEELLDEAYFSGSPVRGAGQSRAQIGEIGKACSDAFTIASEATFDWRSITRETIESAIACFSTSECRDVDSPVLLQQ